MYSKDFIKKIRQESNLEKIIDTYISLKKSGNSLVGDCPLCEGKNKFSFHSIKRYYKCFGCDAGGDDPINFLMKFKGKSFKESIEICADLSNIHLEVKSYHQSNKEQSTFRDEQLNKSGIHNSFQILNLEKGATKNRYESGSVNKYWKKVSGDDMILNYIDLDGQIITYKHPTNNEDIPFIRIRHCNPESHLDKEGKPIKYLQPKGSGSHLWIPELLRMAFQNREKIKTLVVTEGEKKADKMCIHKMMAVGIMGIHNLSDDPKMYGTFLRILTVCEVEEIIFLLDADWNEISTKSKEMIQSRPKSFHSAVRKFKDYFEQIIDQGINLRIYFAHINNKKTKGVDDFLVEELKGKEDELKADFEAIILSEDGKGKYINCHDITSISDDELQRFWNLQDELDFIDAHFDVLATFGTFSINGNFWKIDKDSVPEKITLNSSFEDEMLNTPFLPDQVFQSLPPFLKNLTNLFHSQGERDIFLLSTIAVLSGTIYSVTGKYDKSTVFSNLYFFVLGPAGSGKGVMKFAKALLKDLNKHIKEKNRIAIQQYKADKIQYDKDLIKFNKNGGAIPIEPVLSKQSKLFIPANSSTSLLIKLLNDTEGKGIIFETEADTLGHTLKFDWGNFSHILRKNFHSEPISLGRIGETGSVELENSKFALVLSGTPNQVLGLIPSAEDGLFSRFLFYLFYEEPAWRDVSPHGDKQIVEERIQIASKQFVNEIDFLVEHPTTLHLSVDQWNSLNAYFNVLFNESLAFYGNESVGTVKRLGLIGFRIMMLLSSLRKAADRNKAKNINCHENDFKTAIAIVDTCYQHSMVLLKRLPNAKVAVFKKMPENKKALYKALPDRFKRSDVEALREESGMSRATFDRFLKELTGTYLKRVKQGVYEKCSPPSTFPSEM